MYAIVAYGPNGIEIPCVFFNTIEEALKYVDDARKGREKEIGNWKQGLGRKTNLPFWQFDVKNVHHTPEEKQGWANNSFLGKFFTSYYGGCGDVGAFHLKEIPFGRPWLSWSLD